MECQNCKISVDPKFEFAIRSNNCPACGKNIMGSEKLAAFVGLKDLLSANFKEVDAEKVASLIVANFDLKQLFKTELTKSETKCITNSVKQPDPDAEFKERQKKEAKSILQGMRDEVLNGVLQEKYGFGDGGVLLDTPDENNPLVDAMRNKQSDSQNKIETGVGGLFRRGA